jgi:hypothetical protein
MLRRRNHFESKTSNQLPCYAVANSLIRPFKFPVPICVKNTAMAGNWLWTLGFNELRVGQGAKILKIPCYFPC